MPLEPLVDLARQHGLHLIEDCAQAYAGSTYRGHAECDVSMFSFGPIKTSTALGGAVFRFRDSELCRRFQRAQCDYPVQPTAEYRARLVKYALLKFLSYRMVFTCFAGLLRLRGKTPDQFLNAAVRGFAGDEFFCRIRRQPCAALLAVLARRLATYSQQAIDERVRVARGAMEMLPAGRCLGRSAGDHTHWIFPFLAASPAATVRRLYDKGFDATQGASSLCALSPPAGWPAGEAPGQAARAMSQIVYLPVYPGISTSKLRRLAAALAAEPPCPPPHKETPLGVVSLPEIESGAKLVLPMNKEITY
jgi:dTDP-4-amino-4,6-dideoxygalactose transaminase